MLAPLITSEDRALGLNAQNKAPPWGGAPRGSSSAALAPGSPRHPRPHQKAAHFRKKERMERAQGCAAGPRTGKQTKHTGRGRGRHHSLKYLHALQRVLGEKQSETQRQEDVVNKRRHRFSVHLHCLFRFSNRSTLRPSPRAGARTAASAGGHDLCGAVTERQLRRRIKTTRTIRSMGLG